MLPGKKYTPEDFVHIAWKRKWLLLVPTVLVSLLTLLGTQLLPDRYTSETTIIIVPQQVPENYVRPAISSRIDDRLQMISQQILSRTRLEQIIQEFNLYERERKTRIMEDVVQRMREEDISLEIVRGRSRDDANSFRVGYRSSNPRTAMRVTERLASLFVQENLEDREVLADSTNVFLESQLEQARARLEDQEKKLEQFRRRNMGQLPSQMQSNLQIMQTSQLQLQASAEASSRDRDRLAVLSQSLSDVEAAVAANAGAPGVVVASEVVGPAAQQLEQARAALRALELRLKPEHPDIGRAKRAIAELERKAEAEALQQPLSASTVGGLSPAERAGRARAAEIRTEMSDIQIRLEARKREETHLQDAIKSYGTRIEVAPSLEFELTQLMRDYATLQEGYTALLRKSEEAKMAVNLERRQIGQQFKILDGARLPEKPFSPARLRLNLMGLAGGFAIGLLLAGFLEYRDTTVKTDDDVVISLTLPVLAVIPAMTTAAERAANRRRQLQLIAAGSVAFVAIVVGTLAAWRLDLIARLVR